MRANIRFSGLLALCIMIRLQSHGQNDTLIYSPTLRFPMNPPEKSMLLRDLNSYLNKYTGNLVQSPYLFTMPLTDELSHVKLNTALKDSNFYKGFLNNVVKFSDSTYLIQFSYIGVQNGVPALRASFNLLARPDEKQFTFSSPLAKNILNWKNLSIGNVRFVYPDSLSLSKAKAFQKLDSFYNQRIQRPDQQTVFIVADNFPNALEIAGIQYKMDYAGYAYTSLSDYSNNNRLVISGLHNDGYPSFDPHDLWHDKLRTVMADSAINRPVDEGCAYLFGGSWGYSWDYLLNSFQQYVKAHPDADWLSLYKNGGMFTMGNYQNPIANMVNALLIEKIQKGKGFPAVMELLECGRREKGDANYFAALQRITGITQANFNSEMNKLISGKT